MLTLRTDFPPEKGIMQGKPHYPGHFFVFCIVRQRWERSQCNASPISILRFSKMMEKKDNKFDNKDNKFGRHGIWPPIKKTEVICTWIFPY